MVKAPVNRIIPFSSVDGPGSRTAVFLQGCNLDCRYCHNPETRNPCVGCGLCVTACKTGALEPEILPDGKPAIRYHAERCVFCDSCIERCPNGSSPRIRWMDAAAVYKEISRQVPFIRGVTVSGGECMLWPQFLEELFVLCRQAGLHTLIDSNGTVPFEEHPSLMEVTDGVMLDVKAFNPAQHRQVTSASNEPVLGNLVWLAQHQKLQEVRTVVVPGLFDAEDTVGRTARLLVEAGAQQVPYKLITYREQGVRPEYRLYQSPEKSRMESLAELAKKEGIINPVVI